MYGAVDGAGAARHFNRGSSARQSGSPVVVAACGVDGGGLQRCFNNQHRGGAATAARRTNASRETRRRASKTYYTL